MEVFKKLRVSWLGGRGGCGNWPVVNMEAMGHFPAAMEWHSGACTAGPLREIHTIVTEGVIFSDNHEGWRKAPQIAMCRTRAGIRPQFLIGGINSSLEGEKFEAIVGMIFPRAPHGGVFLEFEVQHATVQHQLVWQRLASATAKKPERRSQIGACRVATHRDLAGEHFFHGEKNAGAIMQSARVSILRSQPVMHGRHALGPADVFSRSGRDPSATMQIDKSPRRRSGWLAKCHWHIDPGIKRRQTDVRDFDLREIVQARMVFFSPQIPNLRHPAVAHGNSRHQLAIQIRRRPAQHFVSEAVSHRAAIFADCTSSIATCN